MIISTFPSNQNNNNMFSFYIHIKTPKVSPALSVVNGGSLGSAFSERSDHQKP